MQQHSQDEAEVIAAKAIASIREKNLAFTPDSFELFYAYHSGNATSVKAEIDAISRANKPLTSKIVERCAHTVRQASGPGAQVSKLTNEVSNVVNDVLGSVRDSTTGNKSFSDSLEGFASTLDGDSSSGAMIQQMLEETRRAIASQWALQEKLTTATEQITSLKSELESATNASLTDQLTGVANRRALDEFLELEIERGTQPISLIIGDVDHFKNFNDKWGHAFGDQVLKLVAKSINQHEPEGSITARFGGEEFIMVAPKIGLQAAMGVADAARKFIGSKVLRKRGSHENVGNLTISMGVACRKPGESVEDLINRADSALYQAKKAGRNRVMSSN